MNRNIAAALAALIVVAAPSMAQDTFNWNGWYAGINLGYTSGSFRLPFTGNLTTTTGNYVLNSKIRINRSGFIGGGQLGYNYLLSNNWLIGAETDGDATTADRTIHATGTLNTTTNYDLTQQTNIAFLNTVRARVGYVLPQNVLVYATAGMAYGGVGIGHNLTAKNSLDNIQSQINDVPVYVGWTVGGGVEYPLSNHISLRTEYLYADLGTHTFLDGTMSIPTPAVTASANYRESVFAHIVRVAVNYKFDL